ncbi:MAG: alanine/glycine:cation symporter family protein [Myxococcota bacterium]|nr:alanine/glycine:cation symporter family protein [Myxococcota bacterium]
MDGIDAQIDAALRPLADAVSSFVFFSVPILGTDVPLVVAWLVVAALFCTVYLRFVCITGFGEALRLTFGPAPKTRDGEDISGEVSHFQALATAVSGTVGVGNIAGVAVAISVGGPGAVFWMLIAGVLGMSSKFAECTLGVKYRTEHPDGSVSGGPMYYLERGLAARGYAGIGRGLGRFYAAGIVIGCLGIGNMFQSNQAFEQLVGVTGGEASWFAERGWLVGLVLAALVGLVIIGGIKSIARVTSKVVPFMALLYLISAAVILVMNAEAIPFAIGEIIGRAFSTDAASGGVLGAVIVGFQRAVFSNEAGIGSAPIAHAAVRTDRPVSEGFVALLEPFIDTIVICSATALVVVTTFYYDPNYADGLQGIAITSAAFERNVSWSPNAIALVASLFALSTMISWSYYGLKGWSYLVSGSDGTTSRNLERAFQAVFCAFVALGCMIKLDSVLDFSDALVFVICIPNIIGLYILAPEVKRELDEYRASR